MFENRGVLEVSTGNSALLMCGPVVFDQKGLSSFSSMSLGYISTAEVVGSTRGTIRKKQSRELKLTVHSWEYAEHTLMEDRF